MAAVSTTQSFANNSGEQPQLALDSTTPESNDSSSIATNNIAAAHDQGLPVGIDDESNNFNSNKIKEQEVLSKLPPGYRFLPTEEELIVFYLKQKVWNQPLQINKIVEVNLYEYNPDFLAENYTGYGGAELYIFTPRERKYPNGSRPNRAAADGYWKATGGDREIKSNGTVVGYRKVLDFYMGRPPKGEKTNWIMHEYRVKDPPPSKRCSNGMSLDDWVLCRIHKKKSTPESNASSSIATNNIAAAHDQGLPVDIDDESNNFNSNNKIKEQEVLSKLPPGYRFLPTDEELIVFYLKKKVWNQPLPINKIVEVNLYEYNPDFLAEKYKDYLEDHQLYIFTPRDRKYPHGRRPNRATGDGYWKANGVDRKIKSNETVVGYRTSLVFYIGKAPKSDKTDWVMHEFRLEDSPCSERGSNGMKLDDWVLCKIYQRPVKSTKTQTDPDNVPAMVGSTSLQDDYDGGDDEHISGNLEGAAIADVKVPITGSGDNTQITTSTFQNVFQQLEFAAQCSNPHALGTGATFNDYFQVVGGNNASPLPATMVPPNGFGSNWVYNSTDQRTVFGSNYLNEPCEFQENLWINLPSQFDCCCSFCQEPNGFGSNWVYNFPNINPDDSED